MNTVRLILLSLLFTFAAQLKAQRVVSVYKTHDLLQRIDTSSVPLVVNFWATWCVPCIKELPAFDSLSANNSKVKVLLVSLDFKEEIEKKVDPFLKKIKILSEVVLLDEVNGNDYINKISPDWSGAIPATLIIKGKQRRLVEKKMTYTELQALIEE